MLNIWSFSSMKNFNNIFIMKALFYLFSFGITFSLQMSIKSSSPKSIKNNEIFNTLLYEEVTTQSLSGFGALQKCGDNGLDVCVPYYNCDPVTNTVLLPFASNYHTEIDLRSERPCDNILEVCCDIVRIVVSPPIYHSNQTNSSSHTETTTLKKLEDVISPEIGEESEPSENHNCGNWSICGKGNSNGISFKLSGNMHNIAQYGEFPWQVLLLKTSHRGKLHTTEIICGGSIIQQNIVLTAAHCLTGFSPSEITIRAGEWDIQSTIESIPYQERISKKFVIHEGYWDNINDIALIFLDRPFIKVKSVGSICLPNTSSLMNYKYCYASGWGSYYIDGQKFSPVLLKKIKSMMISHSECQKSMRETSLLPDFMLHQSLTCARGGKEMDVCGGDGGGPVVCSDPSDSTMGHYIQIGIISKGLGCNSNTSIDVYTNVAKYAPWIKEKIEMFRPH